MVKKILKLLISGVGIIILFSVSLDSFVTYFGVYGKIMFLLVLLISILYYVSLEKEAFPSPYLRMKFYDLFSTSEFIMKLRDKDGNL